MGPGQIVRGGENVKLLHHSSLNVHFLYFFFLHVDDSEKANLNYIVRQENIMFSPSDYNLPLEAKRLGFLPPDKIDAVLDLPHVWRGAETWRRRERGRSLRMETPPFWGCCH